MIVTHCIAHHAEGAAYSSGRPFLKCGNTALMVTSI